MYHQEAIMSVNQAYNFRKVSDSISTAGLLSEDQLKQLGDEGYEAVINLLPDKHDYAIKNEASLVKAQDIVYEYIPVDFAAPTEKDYQLFSEKMSELSNRKIMLHCAANYRVSAFYSIYAYLNHDWSATQVKEFMSSIWNVTEHPVWEEFVSRMLSAKNS
jgi:protein tyrosine phosphatase (PTP) superfamily phosphohydrolase (DUF442 family)